MCRFVTVTANSANDTDRSGPRTKSTRALGGLVSNDLPRGNLEYYEINLQVKMSVCGPK